MRTILVIDDDKSICESLSLYLTEEGYQVESALSGEEDSVGFKPNPGT
jgi:DNA-binding response OmpR family regulator